MRVTPNFISSTVNSQTPASTFPPVSWALLRCLLYLLKPKPVSAESSPLRLLITLSFQLLRPQIWKSSLTILFPKPNVKSISNLAVVSHILGLRPLLTSSSAITLANLLSTGLAALFPLITSNYSQHCSQNDSQGDVNT